VVRGEKREKKEREENTGE
jgi:hypothetical protein